MEEWGTVAGFVIALIVYKGTAYVFWLAAVLYFVNWWRRARRLRQAGFKKHRVRAFAWRIYSAETQRTVASGLDEDALLWAYYLPDHTPQAKQIIVQELARRNFDPKQIRAWASDVQKLTVPPAIEQPVSWKKYLRMTKNKVRWFQFYRVLLLSFIPLVLFLVVTALNKQAAEMIVGALIILIIEIAATFAVLYQKRSLRILLLRPFGEKRMTRTLRRFVPKSIGRFGHVYTLSDRHFRPNFFLTALIFMGIGYDLIAMYFLTPFTRNSIRIARVKNERTFRRLEGFLIRQFRPSLISFLSGGQALNIRSTDAWWQLCIQMLMSSCQVIVVDLSKVKEGTAWEIGEIRGKGFMPKCLFIVAADQQAQIEGVLDDHFGAARPLVFAYNASGNLADPVSFKAYLQKIVLGSKLVTAP